MPGRAKSRSSARTTTRANMCPTTLTKRNVYKQCAQLPWLRPEVFAERVGVNRSLTKRQLYAICAKLAWLDSQYLLAKHANKCLVWMLSRASPNVPWKNLSYAAKHT